MYLMNFENEKQLSFYYYMMLLNREVSFSKTCDHQVLYSATVIEKPDSRPVPHLASSHEEVDTLLILHAIYSDHNIVALDTDIIIHSTDTFYWCVSSDGRIL
ncbi:hypothetical protein PoB_000685800 [Plakobranchus ocellatus]|uniref:Uncharacterized protein n=1 Tax=Plakobranchus ocellatus TaxID=259542 RepID=A0AAV3YD40_9GAST|nr:hypothetical protein PoB_000685800 [Plakobranchus ocellatus]